MASVPDSRRLPASWPTLVTHWSSAENPLPKITLTTGAKRQLPTFGDPAPALATGDSSRLFDFTLHLERLLADIPLRCPALAHVQPRRIMVGIIKARNGKGQGLQARLAPLRFAHGQLIRKLRGITYQIQRFYRDETEILYFMTFCLPRFLNQDFDEKFVTLFHELYHMSPDFDGDLRRLGGRYQIHSHSQRGYDREMTDLARAYLASKPDPGLHAFMRLNFAQLCAKHGGIAGLALPRPKMVPIVMDQPGAASNSAS